MVEWCLRSKLKQIWTSRPLHVMVTSSLLLRLLLLKFPVTQNVSDWRVKSPENAQMTWWNKANGSEKHQFCYKRKCHKHRSDQGNVFFFVFFLISLVSSGHLQTLCLCMYMFFDYISNLNMNCLISSLRIAHVCYVFGELFGGQGLFFLKFLSGTFSRNWHVHVFVR